MTARSAVFKHGPKSSVTYGKWWCPTCRIRLDAPRNPVCCPTCGDDTTIAPASATKD